MEEKEIQEMYNQFVTIIKQKYNEETDPVKKEAIKRLIAELEKD